MMIDEKIYRNYSAGWKSLAADINQLAYTTGAAITRERPFRNVVFTVVLGGNTLTKIERFSEYHGLQDVYEFLPGWGN